MEVVGNNQGIFFVKVTKLKIHFLKAINPKKSQKILATPMFTIKA